MLLVKTFCVLTLSAFFGSAMAETPETCNHTYALCIAAKCTENGSCACKVFEGLSYAYGGYSCKDLTPHGNIVYSTYSTELSSNPIMTCPHVKQWADCMGAPCTRNGSNASCACKIKKGVPLRPQGTLGGNCNSKKNCASSSIWSMANLDLLEQGGASQCPIKILKK